jgi:hypothetical protein
MSKYNGSIIIAHIFLIIALILGVFVSASHGILYALIAGVFVLIQISIDIQRG